jgi:hypothetical protein
MLSDCSNAFSSSTQSVADKCGSPGPHAPMRTTTARGSQVTVAWDRGNPSVARRAGQMISPAMPSLAMLLPIHWPKKMSH